MEEEAKKEGTQEIKPEDPKEELVAAIKEAKGIKDEEPAKSKDSKATGLKQQIASLRKEREEARAAKNRAKVTVLRRRIHRLKKKTGKTA
jgi:hypothetical protein